MERYTNKKGERIIICKEIGSGHGVDVHYSLVNIDTGETLIGFSKKSLKDAKEGLKKKNWDKPKYIAGLHKGMQMTAGNVYNTFNDGLLDRHGFTRIMVTIPADDSIHFEMFALKGDKRTPFIGVSSTDIIKYLGDSKWKFVKSMNADSGVIDEKELAAADESAGLTLAK